MSFNQIKLQKQPNDKTCVQTCLAMAMSQPVENVIEKYPYDGMSSDELISALNDCGIVWNKFVYGMLIYEGWYFAAVPSLNIRGGSHQILIYYTRRGGIRVLDPSTKIAYKKNGIDLVSWYELIPFWPGGKL